MKAPVDIDRLVEITVAGAPPLTNEQVELFRRHLKPATAVIAMPISPKRIRERKTAA